MGKNMNFEAALKQLEDICEKLEKNDCTLDAAIELYAQGTKAVKQCNEILEEAKLQIETIDGNKEQVND